MPVDPVVTAVRTLFADAFRVEMAKGDPDYWYAYDVIDALPDDAQIAKGMIRTLYLARTDTRLGDGDDQITYGQLTRYKLLVEFTLQTSIVGSAMDETVTPAACMERIEQDVRRACIAVGQLHPSASPARVMEIQLKEGYHEHTRGQLRASLALRSTIHIVCYE